MSAVDVTFREAAAEPFDRGTSRDSLADTALDVCRGHELAQIELTQLVHKIRQRVATRCLNRGLSLSLPYFDDEARALMGWEFEVIPRGRIPFVPAFVVQAARREAERVARDQDMSPGTRAHLLELLSALECAFAGAGPAQSVSAR